MDSWGRIHQPEASEEQSERGLLVSYYAFWYVFRYVFGKDNCRHWWPRKTGNGEEDGLYLWSTYRERLERMSNFEHFEHFGHFAPIILICCCISKPNVIMP